MNMEKKLSWHEAIFSRTSRRTYTGEPLEVGQIDAIQHLIADINNESNLHFQLIEDAESLFAGFKASYGMFNGVTAVIALVGNRKLENVQRLIGYYGEFLMLECVALNLGTCWIGGTYDKEATKNVLSLQGEEELFAIISIGKVHSEKSLKEKLISQLGKNKQTFDELLQEKEETVPSWVRSGVEAARLAPSAVNRKPVRYSYLNSTLKAYTMKPNKDIDLGISLAHFELGALKEGMRGEWTSQSPLDSEAASCVFREE